ncbi:MAG: hypothetical protein GF308_15370 [Candidatus Heimdallarchaeota archaeon]|nr:hypothetical protein [Candidatus Heimdallarchaeota archaeon]
MSLEIIKTQRMIRTLYYSLITAAQLIHKNKGEAEKFTAKVESFIKNRIPLQTGKDTSNNEITEFIDTLGWRNVTIDFDSGLGHGKILLGRNRFFPKTLAESEGTLLVIQAIMQGLSYHLFKAPVKATAILSMKSGTFYEISLTHVQRTIPKTRRDKDTSSPGETAQELRISLLTIEDIFQPIFGKNISSSILFEALWKIISESFVAEYSDLDEEELEKALKDPSIKNLNLFIHKIINKEKKEEILNVARLFGEFVVKILTTKLDKAVINYLQPTLRDRHADSYFIYYPKQSFCSNNQIAERCVFIHGLWLNILEEIYGMPIEIKEVFHAGKRDQYCMVEFVRSTQGK